MWLCVGGESHLRVFSCKSHHFRDFFNMYIYYIKLSNSKNYKDKDKHDILHIHGRKNYYFDDFFTPALRSFIFIFFRPYSRSVAGSLFFFIKMNKTNFSWNGLLLERKDSKISRLSIVHFFVSYLQFSPYFIMDHKKLMISPQKSEKP